MKYVLLKRCNQIYHFTPYVCACVCVAYVCVAYMYVLYIVCMSISMS